VRLFGKKRADLAIATAPGMYAGDDPEAQVFDMKTRFRVEANHWKIATFVAGLIALAAILTRQAPEPLVKVVGVSADTTGKPVVRELTQYQPEDQSIRWAFNDLVKRMFTIEPILTVNVSDSRLKKNVTSVKNQTSNAARRQFEEWFNADAPFTRITANPNLVRQVDVKNVSLLPDSTVAVEFKTTTYEGTGAKPEVESFNMTARYGVIPPTADAAVTANPFGIFVVYFTLQKTAD
jgi:type IV secretory pathway TrbF-like protein